MRNDEFMQEYQVRKESGGLSKPTRWRMTQKGEFPKPIQVSPGRVAILRSEFNEWLACKRYGLSYREWGLNKPGGIAFDLWVESYIKDSPKPAA